MALDHEGSEEEPILDIDSIDFDENGNIESIYDEESDQVFTTDKPEAAPKGKTTPAPTAPADKPEAADDQPRSFEQILLESFGLKDERIIYGDEEVNFSELSPADQMDVFSQLLEQERENYRLSEKELTLVNALRGGKAALEDFAREVLGEKPAEMQAPKGDDLHRWDIKREFPELSEAEIETELKERKALSTYDKKTSLLESKYAKVSSAEQEQAKAKQKQDFLSELEADKQTIVKAVAPLEEIEGFTLDKDTKNFILQDLVETDDNGDSPFMRRIEDPKEMFKMNFYYHMVPQMIKHFQSEIDQAYDQGRKDVLESYPRKPVSVPSAGAKGPLKQPAKKEPPVKNIDDLD